MQKFICGLKGHQPGENVIRNGGLAFARCARCGTDLVEMEGEWRVPPKGVKIVWKPAESKATGTPAESETSAMPPTPESEDEPAGSTERSAADRRERKERRKEKAPLPAFLRGKDRRSGQRDRRRTFGRRFTGE